MFEHEAEAGVRLRVGLMLRLRLILGLTLRLRLFSCIFFLTLSSFVCIRNSGLQANRLEPYRSRI